MSKLTSKEEQERADAAEKFQVQRYQSKSFRFGWRIGWKIATWAASFAMLLVSLRRRFGRRYSVTRYRP